MTFLKTIIISTLLITPALAREKTDTSVVEPGKVHEVCMELGFGQKLEYAFMSSRGMKFNIHYHEGEKVSFPVEEYLTKEASDIFTPMGDHGYCMMWTNSNDNPARLNVIYNVR